MVDMGLYIAEDGVSESAASALALGVRGMSRLVDDGRGDCELAVI
jgi:hypothetical protein